MIYFCLVLGVTLGWIREEVRYPKLCWCFPSHAHSSQSQNHAPPCKTCWLPPCNSHSVVQTQSSWSYKTLQRSKRHETEAGWMAIIYPAELFSCRSFIHSALPEVLWTIGSLALSLRRLSYLWQRRLSNGSSGFSYKSKQILKDTAARLIARWPSEVWLSYKYWLVLAMHSRTCGL